LEAPAQRVGLSATVRPHSEVARFLAGERPVSVVAPESDKGFEITVRVPVEDMTARLNEIHAEDTDPATIPPAPPRPPAQIMVPSEVTRGVPSELAMAHHGSVSKERRALIEDALK